jgi:hypothetical protein
LNFHYIFLVYGKALVKKIAHSFKKMIGLYKIF